MNKITTSVKPSEYRNRVVYNALILLVLRKTASGCILLMVSTGEFRLECFTSRSEIEGKMCDVAVQDTSDVSQI